jgi:hypothetical protein
MTKEYCSLSIRVDEDGYTYIVDDRGLKLKGVKGLTVAMRYDELTEATLTFHPAKKQVDGEEGKTEYIGVGVGRMRLF